jgi:hypothetical protein
MKDVTEKNFGVIIAFWLPGFLLLWGLSYSWPEVATWLAKSSASDAPTVGGFLYATLASLAVGLVINAVRWAIVDHFLYWITRLRPGNINYGKLTDKDTLAAFQGAIENNYRYYQYYSNAFVAIVGALAFYVAYAPNRPSRLALAIAIGVALVLLSASRNELNKFNQRAEDITR